MQLNLSNEDQQKILTRFGHVDGLCKILKVDPQIGLNPNDVQSRVSQFGRNLIPTKRPKSFLRLIWTALHDTTLIILIISALVSLSLALFYEPTLLHDEEVSQTKSINLDWVEGTAILITVMAIVLVVSFNDWSKERQFRRLKQKIESEQKVSVLRDSHFVQLHVSELLVGDVCQIFYGHLIPADGLVIESNDLLVDESSLTGETDLVKKNIQNPILYSGTHVMEGSAKILITAVGINSQNGKLMSLLNDSKTTEKQEKSVLQSKLDKLIIRLGYVGISIACLTILILSINFYFRTNSKQWKFSFIFNAFSKFLIIGVTIIVVAVPEGLPLAVTISFIYAVKQMMSDNNLVRHLDACESMGNATTICSDKTGTLTTNRMTVIECYLNGKYYKQIPESVQIPDKIKEIIITSVSINTNYTSKIEKVEHGLNKQIGNKTECALLGFVEHLNGDYLTIRQNNPSKNFVHVYTFNSNRKCMSTCIKHPEYPNDFRLFTKGASEIILNKCKFMIIGDEIKELKSSDINEINQNVIEEMSRDGLRTICLAYRDFVQEKLNWNEDEAKLNDNLTLIAICGIQDPVRPEVPEAIRKCKSAGIVVRMVTGDNINTARSIAHQCGIINPSDRFLVLDSFQFNERIRDKDGEIDQRKFDETWPSLRVLARSSPQDKYILVKHIIESKLNLEREIVAVTGDGTNDGPALKKADVGFAMGIQGTDVAKEASDIILTDDNFNSIVNSVKWGRNVYDSICKFIQFQMTVNLVSVSCAFTGACLIGESPLRAVQMLWVNLIMDTLASLALATERPNENLLKRKPYGRNRDLISKNMIKNIFCQAVYQLTVVFVLLFFGDQFFNIESGIVKQSVSHFKPTQHFTIIFNTFVLMTLFNQINSRKLNGERNVFENLISSRMFLILWSLSFVFQALIVNFGGYAFSCVELTLEQWAWCFVLGIGTLLWGQVIATFKI